MYRITFVFLLELKSEDSSNGKENAVVDDTPEKSEPAKKTTKRNSRQSKSELDNLTNSAVDDVVDTPKSQKSTPKSQKKTLKSQNKNEQNMKQPKISDQFIKLSKRKSGKSAAATSIRHS